MNRPAECHDREDVKEDERTSIRIDYGRNLDSLPPNCSMETMIDPHRRWLREQKRIDYRPRWLGFSAFPRLISRRAAQAVTYPSFRVNRMGPFLQIPQAYLGSEPL